MIVYFNFNPLFGIPRDVEDLLKQKFGELSTPFSGFSDWRMLEDAYFDSFQPPLFGVLNGQKLSLTKLSDPFNPLFGIPWYDVSGSFEIETDFQPPFGILELLSE